MRGCEAAVSGPDSGPRRPRPFPAGRPPGPRGPRAALRLPATRIVPGQLTRRLRVAGRRRGGSGESRLGESEPTLAGGRAGVPAGHGPAAAAAQPEATVPVTDSDLDTVTVPGEIVTLSSVAAAAGPGPWPSEAPRLRLGGSDSEARPI
jgi:hypothetical protein